MLKVKRGTWAFLITVKRDTGGHATKVYSQLHEKKSCFHGTAALRTVWQAWSPCSHPAHPPPDRVVVPLAARIGAGAGFSTEHGRMGCFPSTPAAKVAPEPRNRPHPDRPDPIRGPPLPDILKIEYTPPSKCSRRAACRAGAQHAARAAPLSRTSRCSGTSDMSCCPAPLAVRFINPTNPWLPLLSPAQLVEIHTSFIKFGACHSV